MKHHLRDWAIIYLSAALLYGWGFGSGWYYRGL